jgi:hypothetical protein
MKIIKNRKKILLKELQFLVFKKKIVLKINSMKTNNLKRKIKIKIFRFRQLAKKI